MYKQVTPARAKGHILPSKLPKTQREVIVPLRKEYLATTQLPTPSRLLKPPVFLQLVDPSHTHQPHLLNPPE